jgi:uncharacterized protein YmfQ (DUF2313 family)
VSEYTRKPWAGVATQYVAGLIALAGRGRAWMPQPSSRTALFWLGVSRELVRAHDWFVALVAEFDPRTATDTLDAWERSLGLPESGEVIAATNAERRLDITAKLLARAVVTKAQWVAFAEAAGYTNVTITSGHAAQFTCNSRCNALVTGPYYCAAAWTLTMTGSQNTAFEALANKIKPAHTRLIFVYV